MIVEKLESSSSANIKKTQRKQKNVEDELKRYSRDMSVLRFKSMIFVSITMISLLAIMNATYVYWFVRSAAPSLSSPRRYFHHTCAPAIHKCQWTRNVWNMVHSFSYDGIPIAMLPFEPLGFIQKLSHRNIPGDNVLECSAVYTMDRIVEWHACLRCTPNYTDNLF